MASQSQSVGISSGLPLHEPRKIVKKMIIEGITVYLVKYKGLCDDYNQWIRENELKDYKDLIEEFNERRLSPTKDSKTPALKCREKYFNQYNGIYVVERIVKKRYKEGRVQYKCQYKGYPESQNNWEYFTELYDSLDVVERYEKQISQALVASSKGTSATLFDQGWEAVDVLGIMDEECRENRHTAEYLVELVHQQTGESKREVLVPEECGKGRKQVETLVKGFHDKIREFEMKIPNDDKKPICKKPKEPKSKCQTSGRRKK